MTLIKAALASIPVYFMSIFVILSHLVNQIERLQRDFLWKEGMGTRVFIW